MRSCTWLPAGLLRMQQEGAAAAGLGCWLASAPLTGGHRCSPPAAIREGHLTLFKYLPLCMPDDFVQHLPQVSLSPPPTGLRPSSAVLHTVGVCSKGAGYAINNAGSEPCEAEGSCSFGLPICSHLTPRFDSTCAQQSSIASWVTLLTRHMHYKSQSCASPHPSPYSTCPILQVLTCILDGLADEAEGVRDAALAAGRIAVELYATTALPLLLPAVEAAIMSHNW